MGSGSADSLARYQTGRRYVLALLIALSFIALLFVGSAHDELAHEHIETLGLALIFLGIGGRMWATLYIGGRKAAEIVSAGPYSITRNPLYLFSSVAAAGVGAQTGSYVVMALFAILCAAAFYLVAFREERFLEHAFGSRYLAYVDRVPRFLPNPLLYRDDAQVTFHTRRFRTTMADGLVFLASIPVLEAIEYAQEVGIAPVLVLLP